MQFIDLVTQQKRIRNKIEDNIKKILDHGKYIMGPEIKELEEKLADFCGLEYAVGVASGTDALLMSLMALDIQPGDAVFTSNFTFIATAEVIELMNARPVFVDIDPDTYNLSPEKLREAILKIKKEGKYIPKSIIPVDIFGQCADYEEIQKIADEFGMSVVQDAAQSFGGTYKEKRACSNAEIAATSFFPAKPLGGYGDGGMVFTDSKELLDKLISIRVHGMGIDKYENIRVGINGRLDSIQAAVLLAKMEIFEDELELREKVAVNYSNLLGGMVKTPLIKDHNRSAWAQYSILHRDREGIMKALNENGIPTAVYYKIPLHLQKVFAYLDYKKGDFPVTERVSNEIFSLPMHPYLKPEEQTKIAEIINKIKL